MDIYENPLLVQSPKSNNNNNNNSKPKRKLSASQSAVLQSVGNRSSFNIQSLKNLKRRASKRREKISILQPWFPLVYFYIPLVILSSSSFLPWLIYDLYPAYRDRRFINVDSMPGSSLIERYLPEFTKQPVSIGLFSFEVASLIYLLFLVLSHVSILIIIRPLLYSVTHRQSKF